MRMPVDASPVFDSMHRPFVWPYRSQRQKIVRQPRKKFEFSAKRFFITSMVSSRVKVSPAIDFRRSAWHDSRQINRPVVERQQETPWHRDEPFRRHLLNPSASDPLLSNWQEDPSHESRHRPVKKHINVFIPRVNAKRVEPAGDELEAEFISTFEKR